MRWSSGSRNARIPRREPSGKRKLRGWFNLGAQKTFWKTLHDKGKLVLRREIYKPGSSEKDVCVLYS